MTLTVIAAFFIFSSGRKQSKTALPPSAPLEAIKLEKPGPDFTNELQPDIAEALGLSGNASPGKRLDLLRKMSGVELGDPDCEALFAALLERRKESVDANWHSEYIHEISLALHHQTEAYERFARVLATIANDRGREELPRDYALQHLCEVWRLAENSQPLRDSVQATFQDLVRNDFILAPAALLSLHLLGSPVKGGTSSSSPGQVPDSELEPLLSAIYAQSPAAGNTTARMTALRITRDRYIEKFLPQVRRIVTSNSSEHAVTRMAAIATLGQFSKPEDRHMLASLDQTDPRIAVAVGHALTQIP